MPSDLPKLYLARHADTAWTVSHQHTGRTDLPLNERGKQHARQLGGWLREFSSTYLRHVHGAAAPQDGVSQAMASTRRPS